MGNFIEIADRKIGEDYPPFVIAELSANHNGELERAIELIGIAKSAGADAVKFQTYTADTLTFRSNKPDFKINSGLWAGRTLHDLYSEAFTPWEWHGELFQEAKRLGLIAFSSPFDFTAVDFLEALDVPAYKIASFEAVDLALIKYAAAKGKPLIISTGMANIAEIAEAARAAREAGCKDIALLHCVSGYPAPSADYNLATIRDLADRFDCVVGLSDHTIDNISSICSVPFGASIVEKHFTLDRNGGGPDDSFSLEPKDLLSLCEQLEIAWKAKGTVSYERKASEKDSVIFRRSLYASSDIKKGEVFTLKNVRSVRPGYGLAPKHLEGILGKTAAKDIEAITALDWPHINLDD